MGTNFDDPRFTAFGLFAEAFTGLTNRFAAQFEQHRLSSVEFEVLLRLARSPENRLRMTDLAGQTSLSTSGVTRVVDRMDREGLVRREACPSDRRSSYAVITDAGLARLDDVLPGHLELMQRWFIGQLSPEQLAAFTESLRIIRDAVNPCATAGTTDPEPTPAGR
ncbi:MarR family winged helix-turn-helix transcriptional regulator [Couchioplanes azureus]|uniref:MarR family winged helix-turn-helix transcriptional regulator n=1 Tax=Couchioplanes caeruleus TaxID=56438 RepID=UPI00166FC9E7|nr:MarR family transcriptional regulator [Couchioplanes caeruleus]GGQ46051.1 MarR family transcriptional regulator [Couchioplanes caeruleus subsp. azureus]